MITGIDVDGSGVSWTSMRKKKKEEILVEQKKSDVSLADADGKLDFSSDAVIAPLKKVIHALDGHICLALPSSQMLLRVTELPATAADELQSMVELQVDKFSPFPIEQVCYSYEVLQKQEQSTRVLIVAVREELVDLPGSAFKKCGVILHRVDARLAVRWAMLCAQDGAVLEHGQQSLLIIEPDETSLIVAHHGIPVFFTTFGAHGNYTTQEEVDELLEEIFYALTTIEAEWALVEDMEISVWSYADLSPLLLDRLKETCSTDVTEHRLNELPPLSEGVARRGFSEDDPLLNLARADWAQQDQYRNTLKIMLVLSIFFVAFWASTLGLFILYMNVQTNTYDKLLAGERSLKQEVREIEVIEEKIRSLNQYADRSHSALEGLLELSQTLPGGVELIWLQYKKGKQIGLKGSAVQAAPVHDYISALEKSSMFADVIADDIVSKRRRGQIKTEFSIELKLPEDESG